MSPQTFTPEEYSDRLVDLTESVVAARMSVDLECQRRDAAVAELGRHLNVADGDERIAVVAGYAYEIGRRGDLYRCTIRQIHATA